MIPSTVRGVCFLASSVVFLAACGEERTVAGTYTSTGNAQATGVVFDPSGAAVEGVRVECRPDSLPAWEDLDPRWIVSTDATGRYRCTDLPVGRVGVSAHDARSGLSSWHGVLLDTPADTSVHRDTLAIPGALRIALADPVAGVMHLSGLGRYLPVNGAGEFEFADIPSGWRGEVRLTSPSGRQRTLDSARIRSGRVDSVGFGLRTIRVSLPLAGGASSTVHRLPVLVRLDSSWTGFADTREDGSDLRLATLEGAALPTTVAFWDRAARKGALWTVLDSVASPADSVDLLLHWGTPRGAAAAGGFTSANGWLAAWPLGDTGATMADRTGLHPGRATALAPSAGVVGPASRFDGSLSRIVVDGSETGPLDLVPGGPYTITCWARLTSWKTSRYLVSRGDQGHALKFQKSVDSYDNVWLGRDMRAGEGAGSRYAVAPADTGRWVHLAMVVRDSQVSLWVDGVLRSGKTISVDNDLSRRAAPLLIGASLDSTGAYTDVFSGDLAEVWIHAQARSADWIRLVAANQAPGSPGPRFRAP